MKYTVVVFSSRSETIGFYKVIKNSGLFCSVINTPRVLSASCGVSTKIDSRLIQSSIQIIHKLNLRTFKGIYEITLQNQKELATRIY